MTSDSGTELGGSENPTRVRAPSGDEYDAWYDEHHDRVWLDYPGEDEAAGWITPDEAAGLEVLG